MSDWLEKRVRRRSLVWQDWLDRRKRDEPVEDPWKIVREDTGVDREKGVSCVNMGSDVIPTLPLIPFYDRIYMWIYDRNFNLDGFPLITSVSDFKIVHGLTTDELKVLAREGCIIPISYIEEDLYTGFMRNFWTSLETQAFPFIPRAYAWMLANDFQIENKIFLDWKDPAVSYVGQLAYAAGLESILVTNRPIESLPSQSLATIERTMSAMNKLPLFLENTRLEYFLQGLNLAYSPEMPLNEYLQVFTSQRRKELRALIARLLEQKVAVEDVILEINRGISDLEKLARTRHWRFVSHVGSLIKANARTLTIAAAGATGWIGAGPAAAVAGAVLAKLAETTIPDELSKDLSRLGEDVAAVLHAMILRQSPSILHIIQIRKDLEKIR